MPHIGYTTTAQLTRIIDLVRLTHLF